MNPKLACFLLFVTVVYANVVPLPERYPAGVDPALCPDYPNCDNALLHAPRPVYIPAHFSRLTPDRFPVGVDPAKCPNYPYCDIEVIVPNFHPSGPGVVVPHWP